MRQFTIGDIHGGYKSLIQCFERSGFNYEEDELICLGDVFDGWSQVKECNEELTKVKNLIMIMGNHDYWAMRWYKDEIHKDINPDFYWTSQGGQASIDSYGVGNIPPSRHLKLFENAHIAYEQERNGKKQIFCHGGINPNRSFENQVAHNVMWDRDLFYFARKKHGSKPNYKYGGYDDIFIGHTSTCFYYKDMKPKNFCNVWNIDTGGGWEGKLTIMNTDTKEYWQSDIVKELYPDEKGR